MTHAFRDSGLEFRGVAGWATPFPKTKGLGFRLLLRNCKKVAALWVYRVQGLGLPYYGYMGFRVVGVTILWVYRV